MKESDQILFLFEMSNRVSLENNSCSPDIIRYLHNTGYVKTIGAKHLVEDEYTDPEKMQGFYCSKSFLVDDTINNTSTEYSTGTLFFYDYNSYKIIPYPY